MSLEKKSIKNHCNPCDITFRDKSGLTRHEKTKKHFDKCKELGIKIEEKYDYICCDIKTNRKDIYEEHIKTDTHRDNHGLERLDKTFKCPKKDCDFVGLTKGSLKIHLNGKLHEMSKEEKKKYFIKIGHENNLVGNETEKYFLKFISNLKEIKSIENLGNSGNIYDIKYTLFDDQNNYYMQVKTIAESGDVHLSSTYKNDTLIVGVNRNRDIFCLFQMKDVGKVPSIKYHKESKNNTKYKKYFYNNVNEFKLQLVKNLKNTTILNDTNDGLIESQKQELNSLQRLEKKCKEYFLKYKRNDINNDEIDCFINDSRVQHKSSKNDRFKFTRGQNKSKRPYSDKDKIDIFVFENILDQNNFYIIPIQVLIKKRYIKTDTCNGITNIDISNKNDHWSLNYLNKFDYFKIHKILKSTLNIKLINIIMIYV